MVLVSVVYNYGRGPCTSWHWPLSGAVGVLLATALGYHLTWGPRLFLATVEQLMRRSFRSPRREIALDSKGCYDGSGATFASVGSGDGIGHDLEISLTKTLSALLRRRGPMLIYSVPPLNGWAMGYCICELGGSIDERDPPTDQREASGHVCTPPAQPLSSPLPDPTIHRVPDVAGPLIQPALVL